MLKILNICRLLSVFILTLRLPVVNSAEWLVDTDINAGTIYNENIFLTSSPHNSVSGLIITPKLAGTVREANWEASVDARIRSNNYSDDSLDSNNQYYNLLGSYQAERNIFSLNANYDLDSNLTASSTDFGIAGRVVNRKIQSVSPQYTRLLTERLVFTLTYTYSNVDYLEAENTGFTPYVLNIASALLRYDLTERDKLTINFQGTDYASKNDSITYQVFVPQIGIEHGFSNILSAEISVGVSRNNVTNLSTQSYDFFGDVIEIPQEIDSQSRGFIMNASLTQLLESGSISGIISQNNSTNSFGGLNQVSQIMLEYEKNLSSIWRYNLSGRYEDVTAVSSSTGTTDRNVFFFEARSYYTISQNWNINAYYRYIVRKYKSDTSDDRAPHTNVLYVGMTYNFPSISTF